MRTWRRNGKNCANASRSDGLCVSLGRTKISLENNQGSFAKVPGRNLFETRLIDFHCAGLTDQSSSEDEFGPSRLYDAVVCLIRAHHEDEDVFPQWV